MRLKTYWRLGIINIARVAIYRLGLRLCLHPATRIIAQIGGNDFFRQPLNPNKFIKPTRAWNEEGIYFGWHKVALEDSPPSWLTNPLNGETITTCDQPWWKLSDFNLNVGDIKTIWEASRFDWALALAQRTMIGDQLSLKRLNYWLTDWCQTNPAYFGPNWKCGQEASIRVMHLAMTARILNQPTMTKDLARLIKAHMIRISLTLSYALSQDNNHSTSEAAALFMGGDWCWKNGIAEGKRWANKGRNLLEKQVSRLIASDGSFSQYSVNYHRVLIDTLSMVEVWRRWQALDEFSSRFIQRAKLAIKLLYTLVESKSGDAPNIGGNDGARLLPLLDAGYRDYRPSVQLAMALFNGRHAYCGDETLDLPLMWLEIEVPEKKSEKPGSQQFDCGGYAVLRNGRWMAVLKYPRYRFRPKHCDLLHVDLWYGSENLLRDGGSFSYNADKSLEEYFTGPAAHNTIEFDDRDQMPRLGRFLRGGWPHGREVKFDEDEDGRIYAEASYRDWKGAFHHRKIKLEINSLVVHDEVKGFIQRAVIRWRLQPENWRLEGRTVVCKNYKLRIESDVSIVRFELVQGWESRFYHHKTLIPVLEVEIQRPGKIVSKFLRSPE